ncbi:hypothetical protein IF1G_02692 [Cordyceps javanica]|uniref:Uncharacterized protein n=1 Tax=Cordyceps javanica TaxID=43265 RepID=A0A545VA67_9HYPO|nr:hypothetical protein IF1G_02692 [Cordyceps javanica]TQW09827.1 hypothetical protein IF2G_02617 [Cordyceps javanica]
MTVGLIRLSACLYNGPCLALTCSCRQNWATGPQGLPRPPPAGTASSVNTAKSQCPEDHKYSVIAKLQRVPGPSLISQL